MGQQKLLLDLHGRPIVCRTVEQVAGAGYADILVILGHEHERVLAALAGLSIRHAVNADYMTGMGSSFRTAVENLPDADAAMFALADQPFVTSTQYRRLLDTFQTGRTGIVSVRYGDVTAPPHIFSRALFPELALLQHGARSILERHREDTTVLTFPGDLLQDIDTPEDYERARARWSAGR